MSVIDTSVEVKGYALKSADGQFEPWSYHPRILHDEDVEVKIEYCGICSSDIHRAFGGWGDVQKYYPLIVGHEIVGTVSKIGAKVTNFNLGDRVGVGPHCDCGCSQGSDHAKVCRGCSTDQHNHCNASVETYASTYSDGEHSQGGYASMKRVNQRWVFKIPDAIPSPEAAPLMCAGKISFDHNVHDQSIKQSFNTSRQIPSVEPIYVSCVSG